MINHDTDMADDRAVMKVCGMPVRETDEAACVAWLMRLYQEKVKGSNRRTKHDDSY